MISLALGKAMAIALIHTSPTVSGPSTPIQDDKGTEPSVSRPQSQNPNFFNPQIAIIGDFAATLRDNSGEKRHADFREIEFGFAGDVDPFLRVQAFASLAKEDGETKFEAEEIFGEYTRLGKGFSAKFGKIAAAIGRVQRNHADQLEYNDYPLVIQDVLGDEGLRQTGASLSYRLPGSRFHEFTLEVIDAGDEGPVFNDASLNAPVYAAHYRTFFDFSPDLSGQLGFSFLNGPTAPAEVVGAASSAKRGDMYGFDYTMKWHPGTFGKSAILETEAYWTKPSWASKRTVGAFGRLAYEVAPRWFVTAGLDYSELPGTADVRRAVLGGVTFKLTEFEHWRIEWQRITSNFESDRNVLTLQWQWIIGAHPAHKY